MKSPYRLDHDKVIVPEGDSLLAVIPLSARNMVLTLCEYMNWPAFWRVNPPDQVEWDNIQTIIAEVEQAMSTAISVQLLDGRLEEIKSAIEGIESGGSECDCAAIIDALGALALADVAGSLPPPSVGDDEILTPYTGDLSAHTAVDSDVCGFLTMMATGMANTLRGFADLGERWYLLLFLAAPIVFFMFPVIGTGLAFSLSAVLGMGATIMAFSPTAIRNQADNIELNIDDLLCQYNAHPGIVNAADIMVMLNGLKSYYATQSAAAYAVSAIAYTTDTARRYAAAEWDSLECPECVEGCGGMSWGFANVHPECWTFPEGGTTTNLGIQVTAGWQSTRRMDSLALPQERLPAGNTPYRIRWTWMGNHTGTHTETRCRIAVQRRLLPSGAWADWVGTGSWAFTLPGGTWQQSIWDFGSIDGTLYEYRIFYSWTSWSGTRTATLRSLFIEPV